MDPIVVETNLHGHTISIETGRIAKQADGSVIVRCGDTMLLVTAVCAKNRATGPTFAPDL